VLAVVIAVDRLAKERDLGGAGGRQPGDFAHHVGQLAAPLRAPRHRNDAEGAPIIAATLHRHECGDRITADRGNVLVVLPAFELDIGGARAAPGLRDQLGKTAIAIGTDDEIHLRHLLQQFGTKALRHTTDYAQHVAGPLVALQLTHPSQHALLGVIPHRAGVDEQHVRLGRIIGAHVARPSQDSEHQLGIRDVHLAAVRLDVDATHRQLTVTSKRGRPSHRCVSR